MEHKIHYVEKAPKTFVCREKYTSRFTIFTNSDLQIRLHGDVEPSAKEVYLYLVSLDVTWPIVLSHVAYHFGVAPEYMWELFEILIRNRLMFVLSKKGTSEPIYVVWQTRENFISYSDLCDDPRWHEKREKILKRDDYICQLCGIQCDDVVAHHKIYRNGLNPWEYPDDDLITLCRDCHGKGAPNANN